MTPDGSTTTICYKSGNITDYVDENSHLRREVKDVFGRLSQVQEFTVIAVSGLDNALRVVVSGARSLSDLALALQSTLWPAGSFKCMKQ